MPELEYLSPKMNKPIEKRQNVKNYVKSQERLVYNLTSQVLCNIKNKLLIIYKRNF